MFATDPHPAVLIMAGTETDTARSATRQWRSKGWSTWLFHYPDDATPAAADEAARRLLRQIAGTYALVLLAGWDETVLGRLAHRIAHDMNMPVFYGPRPEDRPLVN